MRLKYLLLFTLGYLLSTVVSAQELDLPFTPKKGLFQIFRVKVAYKNYQDEALIYGAEGATDGFDKQFDAYKLFGSVDAPQLYFSVGDKVAPLSVNGVPTLAKGVKARLFIRIPTNGIYEVSLGLKDLTTLSASMLDIKTGNTFYGTSFTFESEAAEEREFEIEFTDGVYWHGIVDSDWNNSENWFNGVEPTGERYAILPKLFIGNSPIVAQQSVLDADLVIEDGAVLTIAATGALNMQNQALQNLSGYSGLLMQSSELGSAQLISSNSAEATVVFHANANSNTPQSLYVSEAKDFSFVSSEPASFSLLNYTENKYAVDSDAGVLANYWNTTSHNEVSDDNAFWVSASEDVQFSLRGKLLASDKVFDNLTRTPIANTNSFNGWHCLTNPFSSGIVINASWLNEFYNVSGVVYYLSDGTLRPFVLKSGVGMFDGYIPVGGAFYIRTTENGGKLTIPASSRQIVHTSADYESVASLLKVSVSGNGNSNSAILYTHPEATASYDAAYDALHVFDNPDSPQIFWTTAEGEELTINGIDQVTENTMARLSIVLPEAGEYTLQLSNNEFEGVPLTVYNPTINKLYRTTEIVLNGNKNEKIDLTIPLGTKTLTSPVVNSTDSHIFIIRNNTISIQRQNNAIGVVSVYNTLGKLVLQKNTTDMRLDFSLPNGVYLVKTISEKGSLVRKLIIK